MVHDARLGLAQGRTVPAIDQVGAVAVDIVVSPTTIAFNPQQGSAAPALQPGQVIDARVVEVIDGATVRLAIGDAVFDVSTQVALVAGSTVRLAVRETGAETRLVIIGIGPPVPGRPAPSPSTTAPSQPRQDQHGSGWRAPAQARLEPGREAASAATPDGALAQALCAAAAHQGGLAPLFADLAEVLARLSIPARVRAAAAQALALRPAMETAAASDLATAFSRSGILLEARLAAAAGGAAGVSPSDDLKAALLVLRQALAMWLYGEASPAPPMASEDADRGSAACHVPPPYRGAPTSAQPAAAPSLVAEMTLRHVGKLLLAENDAALARLILLQAASLPEDGDAHPPSDLSGPCWNFEVPFALAQGTAIAHFEIACDLRRETGGREAAWRARFSMDVEPVGPLHAQVWLAGRRAAVQLWAERASSAGWLRAELGALTAALSEAGLDTGAVLVRHGSPPRAGEGASGRFLDRAS